MTKEMTTGLDGCQEALVYSPWVDRTQNGHRSNMSTHHRVVLHYIRIQTQTYIQKTWKQHKETRGTRSDSKKEESREDRDSGGGYEEKKGGGGKKSLSSFRPSRLPVVFQTVSFTGLGKWSTAASLTYIVCIMLLLELPGRGEGCWTVICIELLSSLSQPAELSLSLLLSPASKLLDLNKPSREAW